MLMCGDCSYRFFLRHFTMINQDESGRRRDREHERSQELKKKTLKKTLFTGAKPTVLMFFSKMLPIIAKTAK